MRRHRNPDDDLVVEDHGVELQRAFALLLPIRRQRLRRSERYQRQAEQALRDSVTQGERIAHALGEHQTHYQALRDAFADCHMDGTQKQEQLMQGLVQERSACEAVAGHKHALVQCQHQQRQHTNALDQAQRDTLARQRDLEKLEYMMQESEVLR